jgi:sarcosine/dimethylglycine N-methyltransferase
MRMPVEDEVARHYGSTGIAERVLVALRESAGPDAPVTPDALGPFDQFHGGGPVATRALVALLEPKPGEQLLDIGSGIGGPARWIATKCGCHVTGIDLTAEFCAAAEELNAATRIGDRVTIMHGSALALPLPDGTFDAAYSQNVIMNIADKALFYREAFRALRPSGRLALGNVCAGVGELHYPVPWAATPETSFLATTDEMRAQLIAAGFEIVEFRDTTEASRAAYAQNRARPGPVPLVAVDIIHGPRAPEMQRNTRRNVEEGRVRVVEALVRKPG